MGGRRFKRKGTSAKTSGSKDANVPTAPKEIPATHRKHHGRDLAMGAAGAIVEYLAIVYGAYWLAWFGVGLLFAAFYEYSKDFLSKRSPGVRHGSRVAVLLVMLVAGLLLVKIHKGLEAYFHMIYVGDVGKGSMVLFLIDMHNSGEPSIAENYRLSARLANGKELRDISPTIDIHNFQKANGQKLATIQKSWLSAQTLAPIPHGGMACGWILFLLPDTPYEDVKKGNWTTWTLAYSDVDGSRHSAILGTDMAGKCCEKAPHDDPCVEEQINKAALED
jgi:hypothetical protein